MTGYQLDKREKPISSEELAGPNYLKPYVDHMLDEFGPDRCMFESNFPMDKTSCSYTVLWNAFKRCVMGRADYTPDNGMMEQLLGGTAREVYGL